MKKKTCRVRGCGEKTATSAWPEEGFCYVHGRVCRLRSETPEERTARLDLLLRQHEMGARS